MGKWHQNPRSDQSDLRFWYDDPEEQDLRQAEDNGQVIFVLILRGHRGPLPPNPGREVGDVIRCVEGLLRSVRRVRTVMDGRCLWLWAREGDAEEIQAFLSSFLTNAQEWVQRTDASVRYFGFECE